MGSLCRLTIGCKSRGCRTAGLEASALSTVDFNEMHSVDNILCKSDMTERIDSKKGLAAPCGLYCGLCGVYIAHRDYDLEFKERLAKAFGLDIDDIRCNGCCSDELFMFCQSCHIRSCVADKGIEGCHKCNDFPCGFIDNFPLHHGRRVMLRAIPTRRELGIERWIEEEERRYHCPYCGYKTYLGAEECWNCKEPVDVD